MARKIEMHWVCTACHTRNLGRHKRCPNCGDPKDASEPWLMPSDTRAAPTVTDSKLLRQANAGPDWQCGYCGSHQRRLDGRCAQCGAAQTEGERVPKGGSRKTAQRWGGAAVPVRRQARRPRKSRFTSTARAVAWIVAFSGVLSCGLCMVFALIFAPDPAPPVLDKPEGTAATIASLSWTRVTHVERLEVVDQAGFVEDRPNDAFDIQSLGQAHHHDEQVLDHHETEHYTESVPYQDTETYTEQEQCGEDCYGSPESCHEVCTPGDNGFASCRDVCSGGGQSCSPRYCSVTRTRSVTRYRDEPRTRQVPVYRTEPRYQERFSWHAWRWQPNRNVSASGDGSEEPHWVSEEELQPPEPLAEGERERTTGTESYGATVETDEGEALTVTVPGLAEYQTIQTAERWWVVTMYGGTARMVKPIPVFEPAEVGSGDAAMVDAG